MDERQKALAELRENQRYFRRFFWYEISVVIVVSLAGLIELWMGDLLVFLFWGAFFALWLDMAQSSFRIWRKCAALLKTVKGEG